MEKTRVYIDKEKALFTSVHGLNQFMRILIGLKNDPAT